MSPPVRDLSVLSAVTQSTYASFASCASRVTRRYYRGGTDAKSRGPTKRLQRTDARTDRTNLGMSVRTRSTVQHRPYKTRPMFPMSKTWNGDTKTFKEFRCLLEGFLLQAGVGYLFDKAVLAGYRELGESYFHTGTFYERFRLNTSQVEYDKSYLYGILLSATRKNSSCPILQDPRYRDYCDGILCWAEFCDRYQHNGNPYAEAIKIEERIRTPFVSSPTTSSLHSYLDRYETNTYVLQSILAEIEHPLSESYLKRTLLGCLRSVSDIQVLVQKACDTADLSFSETLSYLRKNLVLYLDTGIT